MVPYLPEWKIYLWKKLLLDRPDPEAVLSVDNFLYFSQEEYKDLSIKHMQKVIDSIPHRMIFQNGAVIGVDNSMDTPSGDHYYSFKPQSILLSVIGLVEQNPPCMEITEIFLKKEIIEKYRSERKKYLSEHDRKTMASLTNPMGRGWISNPDKRFTDPLCGLPQSLYEKVENGEEISLSDLKDFASSTENSSMLSLASFKVKVNTKNMSAYVDAYIDDYIAGNLVASDGVRYFQFQLQKDNIFGAIKQIAVKFGSHNMVITSEEVAKQGGWEYKDERHYRFYDTLLALEKTGEIEIKSLRGAEIIISILDNQTKQKTIPEMQEDARERFNKDYNQFGIRKEILSLSDQVDKYQTQMISVNEETKKKKESGQLPQSNKDPITDIGKDGVGYLVIHGESIPVGDSLSGKFRLVETLCRPKFGTRITTDMAYMTQPKKGKNNTNEILTAHAELRKKFETLDNQIKEVNRTITAYQKEKGLKDFKVRLSLKCDSKTQPRSVWLEQRVVRRG